MQVFRKKELSTTQKAGVIICLPKGKKYKRFFKKMAPNHTFKCNL